MLCDTGNFMPWAILAASAKLHELSIFQKEICHHTVQEVSMVGDALIARLQSALTEM